MKIQRRAEGACASASVSSRLKWAVIAAFVALVVFALAIPAGSVWASTSAGAAHVNYAGGTTDGGDVIIGKTAADATEADTFDITLSVEGSEARDNVAVLFVLDYSTSVNVRQAAADMLNELAFKTDTNVKYGVINYWSEATEGSWTTLEESVDVSAVFDKPVNTGGTNIHAGFLAAQDMLKSPEVEGYTTYLVTISDGITYLWSDDDGTTMSVWFQNVGNGAYDIQNANSVYDMKYHTKDENGNVAYQPIPTELFSGLVNGSSDVVERYNTTIEKAAAFGSSKPDPSATDKYWAFEDENTADTTLIGNEIAIYKSAQAYKDLLDTVDYAYAYKLDENHWARYPYGEQLMDYLASCDRGGEISDSTAYETFKGISNQILYAVKSGTVTDTMGSAVDFVVSDTLEVTVTDKATGESERITLNKQVEDSYASADGSYAAQIATDESGNEVLTWKINTPVVQGTQVSLRYAVVLPAANKATAAGTYEERTNESAVFAYESTAGESASLEFAKPTVSYTVEEQVTPTVPPATEDDPNGDDSNQTTNNESNSSATVSVTTSGTTDDTSSSSPKTGDAFGLAPLVALLVVVGASGAGIFAWRKLR